MKVDLGSPGRILDWETAGAGKKSGMQWVRRSIPTGRGGRGEIGRIRRNLCDDKPGWRKGSQAAQFRIEITGQ